MEYCFEWVVLKALMNYLSRDLKCMCQPCNPLEKLPNRESRKTMRPDWTHHV